MNKNSRNGLEGARPWAPSGRHKPRTTHVAASVDSPWDGSSILPGSTSTRDSESKCGERAKRVEPHLHTYPIARSGQALLECASASRSAVTCPERSRRASEASRTASSHLPHCSLRAGTLPLGPSRPMVSEARSAEPNHVQALPLSSIEWSTLSEPDNSGASEVHFLPLSLAEMHTGMCGTSTSHG